MDARRMPRCRKATQTGEDRNAPSRGMAGSLGLDALSRGIAGSLGVDADSRGVEGERVRT